MSVAAVMAEDQFPRTRAECEDGPRPCPWMRCRYHLWLEIRKSGSLKFMHMKPALALARNTEFPEGLPPSCALDEAEKGAMTLRQVAERVGLTNQRVEQILQDVIKRSQLVQIGRRR